MKRAKRLAKEYARASLQGFHPDGTQIEDEEGWTPFHDEAATDFEAGYRKALEDAAPIVCPHDNPEVVDKSCCRDRLAIGALADQDDPDENA